MTRNHQGRINRAGQIERAANQTTHIHTPPVASAAARSPDAYDIRVVVLDLEQPDRPAPVTAHHAPRQVGEFGIVDAMFAPVCIRFRGYGVALGDPAMKYMRHMLALPAMREWQAAAEAEPARAAADHA